MKKFKHELKAAVVIALSGVACTVIGRSDGLDFKDQYRVEGYDPINCKIIDDWFYESQIKTAPVAKKTVRKPVAKKTVRKPVAKKTVRKPVAKKALLPKPSTGVK